MSSSTYLSSVSCNSPTAPASSSLCATRLQEQAPVSLVFVAATVPDAAILVAGVTPGTEVHWLDPNRDAITQISQVLQTQKNITSLHIVSHGAPSRLEFGSSCLTGQNLSAYASHLQTWGTALTPHASLLLYGCEVAAGAEGEAFVQRLSQLTGVAVAASVDRTGNADLGGSWELAMQTGSVDPTLAFTPETQQRYAGVLVQFTPATPVGVGTGPFSVALGDFNGDGRLDLATANQSSNNVSIRLGDGAGGFTGTTNIAVGTNPNSVALGDFNADGRLDFAATNANSNNVSIRLGDGVGGFTGTTNIAVGTNPTNVALGDFNGDGRLDFAATNVVSNNVSIRLGDGAGGFTGTTNIAVGTNPNSVALGDFNADGRLDLAVVNLSSANVSIRLGDGAGSFTGTSNIAVGTSPASVALGDVNGDGRLDLATTSLGSRTVFIRLGDGAGNFTGTTNIAVGLNPYSVAFGDFNGDGRLDLATANEGSSNVSIRLGDGAGGFTGTTNIAVGMSPFSVALGDVNGDGRLDLATANVGSANASILLNTPITVSLSVSSATGTEAGTTAITVTATAAAAATGNQTVSLGVTGTGITSSDFLLNNSTLTIANGQTTGTATFTILDDTEVEPTETATLTISNPSNGIVLGATTSQTISITDNDVAVTPTPTPAPTPTPTPTPTPVPTSNTPSTLISNAIDVFSLSGGSGSKQLQFSLTERSAQSLNEVGVYLVDDDQGRIGNIAPGQTGYAQAALSRSQVVFSTLGDRTSTSGFNFSRVSSFTSGDRFQFFLVQNGSIDSARAGQGGSLLFSSTSTTTFDPIRVGSSNNGVFTVQFEDGGANGDNDFNDLVLNVQLTNTAVTKGANLQNQPQTELIDLRGQTTASSASFTVSSEARYNNTIGFYTVNNVQGQVTDPTSGATLSPGDAGYAQAALRLRVATLDRNGSAPINLPGGRILAPFLISNSTVDNFLAVNPTNQSRVDTVAYFAYLGANPDRQDHIRLLGDNTFGFEDLAGGGDKDFNDIVAQVRIA